MRFGTAKELITPDTPMYMIGYAEYYRKHYQSVHDDIYVRCLLLNDGKTNVLLLAYDLLFHDFSLTEEVRQFAASEYGVLPSSVILSYTHTHYSVAVKGYASEEADEAYEHFLLDQTKRCIRKVFLNTFEGTLYYGILRADENINRRKLVDGEYIMAPNLEAPKDNDLTVLLVRDLRQSIKVIAVNYSCHPNLLRDVLELSSEYPGRICQLLEAEFYGAQAIFFQGCGADTRARVTAEYDHFVARESSDVDDMAKSLASKIIRAVSMGSAFCRISLDIKTSLFTIACPLEVYPKSYYEADFQSNPFEALRECAKFVVENYDHLPEVCMLHGGVWQMSSNVILVYLGGEICYSTKQVLMQAFPGKNVIFFGYSDSTAYVPSDKIIMEGGYEHEGSIIEYRLKGTFRLGIDRMIVDAVKKAMKEFES